MKRCSRLMLSIVGLAVSHLGRPAAVVAQPDAAPAAAVASKQDASKTSDSARVVLTKAAAKKILKIQEGLPRPTYLRLFVSDEQFQLEFKGKMDPEKELLSESRGVSILVDRQSAALLPVGIIVDFVDEGGAKGFKFASPGSDQDQPDAKVSFSHARRGFKTTLRSPTANRNKAPVPEPPPEIFRVVRYDAPPGKLTAYLTPDPMDGKKHPAIVWIAGGDCNSIGTACWEDGGVLGSQSASEYRKAGIVMMFPSLRGGNDNPGVREAFFGEVNDVLAAAAFLRKQPYIDADRVYLGGHSTGGTLVLLTAEFSDSFRAVFSFGPADDVLGYGLRINTFSLTEPKELWLRSPGRWLHSIRSPVFVFEGAADQNIGSLRSMSKRNKNPKVHFLAVARANHFNLLGATNRLIANKILMDTGPACDLAFTEEEVDKAFIK